MKEENKKFTLTEQKHLYFPDYTEKQKKRWYLKNHPKYKARLKILRFIKFLIKLRIPFLRLSGFRWILVDTLRGKNRKFWGIYQFVGLPGEGKTISMVAHMERALQDYPNLVIGTNFGYAKEQFVINHWMDIIKVAAYARKRKRCCVIAIDEIHVNFEADEWRSFPKALLALLSFNRKYNLQFLCSSQIYERIPKKIRDIANYTVICDNWLGADRLFKNYYYRKADYEATFDGTKKKAHFLREFVADDDLYNLYDTKKLVDKMTAQDDKDKRIEAFELLFGKEEPEAEASVGA